MRNKRLHQKPKKYGRRYPWRKWFFAEEGYIRDSFSISRPKDYECSQLAMGSMIRQAAMREGISVSLRFLEDSQKTILVDIRGMIE